MLARRALGVWALAGALKVLLTGAQQPSALLLYRQKSTLIEASQRGPGITETN